MWRLLIIFVHAIKRFLSLFEMDATTWSIHSIVSDQDFWFMLLRKEVAKRPNIKFHSTVTLACKLDGDLILIWVFGYKRIAEECLSSTKMVSHNDLFQYRWGFMWNIAWKTRRGLKYSEIDNWRQVEDSRRNDKQNVNCQAIRNQQGNIMLIIKRDALSSQVSCSLEINTNMEGAIRAVKLWNRSSGRIFIAWS